MGLTLQPLRVPLAEGEIIAGKYMLVRQVGEGGMCLIYEVEHVGLGQGFALKVLKPELAGDADCVTRFEREARAAAKLRSPNIAKVFDVDYLPGGAPYMTMELLAGHDLGKELSKSGRLPSEIAVDYVRQACTGIAEAHALGIVHRDLKPENLFLTELGILTDRKLVKILDFGIAMNVSDATRRLTAPDAVFGTVDYMSPEQIRSASTVDLRTDLWSLGIILYELLTGRTPYEGDARSIIAQIVGEPVRPPTALVADLSPALASVVMRMLDKDPKRRFQSAEDVRAALEGFVDVEPITSVIARLPPQSLPRRSVRATPSKEEGSPLVARDSLTHRGWETKDAPRPWRRTRVVMPTIALVLGGAAGFLYWSGQGLGWLARTPPVSASQRNATASSIPVIAAPASPQAPEAIAIEAASASSAALPLAAPSPTAASADAGPLAAAEPPGGGPGETASPAASASAKPSRPRLAPLHAPRPAPAPPTTAPPAPRLPRHI